MTAYPTCTGCALRVQSCERRKAVRDQIKGLHVTSIRFKCDERRPIYERGQLVWARTHDGSDERDDDGSRFFDYFPAVVVGEASGKPLVFIEPGSEGYEHGVKFKPAGQGMCKISLKWLKPRDGGPEVLCEHCDMPARLPHQPNYACEWHAARLRQASGKAEPAPTYDAQPPGLTVLAPKRPVE